MVCMGDSPSNCGLSRASQAVQPEDQAIIVFTSPIAYLTQTVDVGFREAGRFVLPMIRVEGRFKSVWQTMKLLFSPELLVSADLDCYIRCQLKLRTCPLKVCRSPLGAA